MDTTDDAIRGPDQGPLQGIKVLDLSTAIAGPFACAMLADQGAEVIKIEAPGMGDVMRYIGASRNGLGAMFQMSNRGKRSLVLNLKTDKGIAILKQLVANADVLLHNFRVGVDQRLGISYEDLATVNPQLIYVSIHGFGHRGPDAGKRAYDNVIQAFSGIAYNQANQETGEPVQNYQAIADKLTSMNATQAVTAALYARAQGRGGQHIRLNMVDSVVHFLWMDASGTATFLDEGADAGVQVAKGVPLIKFANGYGQAAPVSDAEFHGLCRSFGVDSTTDPRVATVIDRMSNKDVMADYMAQIYQHASTTDVDEGIAAMEANDVPCAKAMAVEELPAHPQLIANQTFVESRHPVAGNIQQPRMAAEYEGTPAGVGAAAAQMGEHSEAILAELGLLDQLDQLRAEGVIA